MILKGYLIRKDTHITVSARPYTGHLPEVLIHITDHERVQKILSEGLQAGKPQRFVTTCQLEGICLWAYPSPVYLDANPFDFVIEVETDYLITNGYGLSHNPFDLTSDSIILNRPVPVQGFRRIIDLGIDEQVVVRQYSRS